MRHRQPKRPPRIDGSYRAQQGLARLLRGLLALLVLPALAAASASAKDLGITPQQMERLGIRLGEVRAATAEATATVPGTVIPPLNGRIAAPVPYAGTVLAVSVLPGQTVRKSDPLVTIASRELLEAISRLRQAEAELHGAEAVSRRMATLAAKDIVNRDRADEAAAQREKIHAAVEELRRATSILGIRVNSDGSYAIVAPQDGRVFDIPAAPGGRVEAMAAGALIDTSEDLWVEAHVPSDLITSIAVGDAVRIKGGPSGKVVSIAGALDPGSRSARLMADLGRGRGLVGGQMVALEIIRRGDSAGFEVQSGALGWIDGGFAVFVRTSTGFSLQKVTVRSRTSDVATVEGDLKAGQQVAVSGLAQLEKMAAGE